MPCAIVAAPAPSPLASSVARRRGRRRRGPPSHVASAKPSSSSSSSSSTDLAAASASVSVPAAPPKPPALLSAPSTPGLVAGLVFGGLPLLAAALRRKEESAEEADADRSSRRPRPASPLPAATTASAMTTTTTPPPSTPLPKGEGAIGSKLPGRAHETCAYLDYNATTPIYPEVAAAMEPFLWEHFGNPSSGHAFAAPCRDAIATARNRVATVLGCAPDEIVFTSCGSESDNHAIASAVEHARRSAGGRGGRVPHVVTTAVEHPAILGAFYTLVPIRPRWRGERRS
jgi:hypothetical protein